MHSCSWLREILSFEYLSKLGVVLPDPDSEQNAVLFELHEDTPLNALLYLSRVLPEQAPFLTRFEVQAMHVLSFPFHIAEFISTRSEVKMLDIFYSDDDQWILKDPRFPAALVLILAALGRTNTSSWALNVSNDGDPLPIFTIKRALAQAPSHFQVHEALISSPYTVPSVSAATFPLSFLRASRQLFQTCSSVLFEHQVMINRLEIMDVGSMSDLMLLADFTPNLPTLEKLIIVAPQGSMALKFDFRFGLLDKFPNLRTFQFIANGPSYFVDSTIAANFPSSVRELMISPMFSGIYIRNFSQLQQVQIKSPQSHWHLTPDPTTRMFCRTTSNILSSLASFRSVTDVNPNMRFVITLPKELRPHLDFVPLMPFGCYCFTRGERFFEQEPKGRITIDCVRELTIRIADCSQPLHVRTTFPYRPSQQ